MDAVNFTANGTRWRAVSITPDDLIKGHVPPLTTTGVLFTSADGDRVSGARRGCGADI